MIPIRVHHSVDQRIAVDIDLSWTLAQFKEHISHIIDLDLSGARFILNGRILRDDEKSLDELLFSPECVIHVTEAKRAVSPTVSPSSPQQPDMFSAMLGNPLIKALMSKPEVMKSLIENDPRMRKIAEENPEFGDMIRDGKFLEQMSEATRNPTMMKELQRNTDRAMANIESMPGGFDALKRAYHMFQEPMLQAPDRDMENEERKNRELAAHLNVQEAPKERINDAPLPNPWSTQSGSGLSNLFGLSSLQNQFGPSHSTSSTSGPNNAYPGIPFHMNPALPVSSWQSGPPGPPNPFRAENADASNLTTDQLRELETKYQQELVVLEGMGFTNRHNNISALLKAGGNVNSAVELLLSQ